jgi:hypothetical protein
MYVAQLAEFDLDFHILKKERRSLSETLVDIFHPIRLLISGDLHLDMSYLRIPGLWNVMGRH